MGFTKLIRTQKLPADPEIVWQFIADPANLNRITPPGMGFSITSGREPGMYPGMIISYRVKPLLRIPVVWVTEITQVVEGKYFVDEQRIGPYAMWHHEHHLLPVENGVLMKDIVSYKPPFGFLGRLANHLFIRKKLKAIFDYRAVELEKIFGKWAFD